MSIATPHELEVAMTVPPHAMYGAKLKEDEMETTREDPAAALWWSGTPEDWLRQQLAGGRIVRLAVLMEQAERARISPHQLEMARLRLGVEASQVGFGNTPWHWQWRLRKTDTGEA